MRKFWRVFGWVFLGIFLQFKFNLLYGIVFLENLNLYPGVYNISDNYSIGKSEIQIKLLPAAANYGINIQTITDIDNYNDIENLSALINCLDLVITIQNSTAHLAGALGKNTWIMLTKNARWHWLTNEKKALWYPTVTLFRQEKIGDWNGMINSIGRDLKKIIN